MSEFIRGQIVKLDIKGKQYLKEGFASGGLSGKDHENELVLYSEIDLESFPSFRDFIGARRTSKHGEVGIVLEKVGRPWKINTDKKWEHYDVYQVLLSDGFKAHVFKHNLVKFM